MERTGARHKIKNNRHTTNTPELSVYHTTEVLRDELIPPFLDSVQGESTGNEMERGNGMELSHHLDGQGNGSIFVA